jgi:hypothetical protein
MARATAGGGSGGDGARTSAEASRARTPAPPASATRASTMRFAPSGSRGTLAEKAYAIFTALGQPAPDWFPRKGASHDPAPRRPDARAPRTISPVDPVPARGAAARGGGGARGELSQGDARGRGPRARARARRRARARSSSRPFSSTPRPAAWRRRAASGLRARSWRRCSARTGETRMGDARMGELERALAEERALILAGRPGAVGAPLPRAEAGMQARCGASWRWPAATSGSSSPPWRACATPRAAAPPPPRRARGSAPTTRRAPARRSRPRPRVERRA